MAISLKKSLEIENEFLSNHLQILSQTKLTEQETGLFE